MQKLYIACRYSCLVGFICLVFLIFSVVSVYYWVSLQTQDRVYSDIQTVPTKSLALLLGTSKYVANGRTNLYFRYRIEATAQLYHAGKIRHIIVSGDNRKASYNEPLDMQKALLEAGIPVQAITLDYAGFRTLDSVVRAHEVFSQNDFIIVSQAFHNQRALFISDFYGIQAIGFNAKDVPLSLDPKTPVREYLARFKAVLDLYILNTQPRFLGDKIHIALEP
ncbi:SanA/YdcF family protein [Beggiatoa leptomitoformis]|nr:ElyC/SanA/YdcF family protein [Beggiatoa leptomitoformis]